MNLKENIQELLEKFKENDERELIIVFKTIVNYMGDTEYVPTKTVFGKFIEDEETGENFFLGEDNTMYYHMLNVIRGEGYLFRTNMVKYRKNYPLLPDKLIQGIILKALKKLKFKLGYNEEEIPLIFYYDKKGKNNLVIDSESVSFYEELFPEFYESLFESNENKVEKPTVISKVESSSFDIRELYEEVTSSVIDQDEPIKKILTAIWKQYNNFSSNKSRNILINGSTGVGKTEIFRVLSNKLDVPCAVVNATDYTAEGYVGQSVSDMLVTLLKRADGNIEKAQRGILIIDEIDKLAESNKNSSQINQKDVQEALLKLLEDGTFYLKIGDNISEKRIEFNTSNLMVIGMGSFSRIDLTPDKVVGFETITKEKKYKDITREDMIKNGMLPELIGRFPVIVQMNELSKESFTRILKNPKTSTLTKNQNFFNNQGIKLTVSDEVINAIADKAEKQELGARSLDEIVETALSRASFEIAMYPNEYEELVITPETIKDNKVYRLVRRKSDE